MNLAHRVIVIPQGRNRGVWFSSTSGLDYLREITPGLPVSALPGAPDPSLCGLPIRVARPAQWVALEQRATIMEEPL